MVGDGGWKVFFKDGVGRWDGEHRLISRASSHFPKMMEENPESRYGLNSINTSPNGGSPEISKMRRRETFGGRKWRESFKADEKSGGQGIRGDSLRTDVYFLFRLRSLVSLTMVAA